ncbi:MAG: hypothetical protein IKV87_02250, partial [Methanobrevibacter sp.]|nr:hypothetical protein [Methanobrevibacter sp.]
MLNEFEKQSEMIFKGYFEKKIDFNDCISKLHILKSVWNFCRIDIKNFGIESNLIKILDSKNNLKVSFPAWFSNDQGQGCKIETDDRVLDFSLKCVNDGNLRVFLRGIDYR